MRVLTFSATFVGSIFHFENTARDHICTQFFVSSTSYSCQMFDEL